MGAGITALASQLEFISGEALNGIYNVLCQDLPLIFSPCYSSEVLICFSRIRRRLLADPLNQPILVLNPGPEVLALPKAIFRRNDRFKNWRMPMVEPL